LGVIATLLPLVSLSYGVAAVATAKFTVMVADDWRGQVGLALYIVTLFLAVLLYTRNRPFPKPVCWSAVGVGIVAVVLAMSLLIRVLNLPSVEVTIQDHPFLRGVPQALIAANMPTFNIAPGVGVLLNVPAAAMVALGGLMKAWEERLI
jgi:hypothetical protein